jgi:hypothetical protein
MHGFIEHNLQAFPEHAPVHPGRFSTYHPQILPCGQLHLIEINEHDIRCDAV